MKWQSLKILAFPTTVLTKYQECKIGARKGTLILFIEKLRKLEFPFSGC